MTESITFQHIALDSGDRAFAAGGTQSGKSTLCAGSTDYPFTDSLCGDWVSRYGNDRDNGKLCIVDSKPRFHAAYTTNGLSDNRRYRNWGYGPAIPGSTRVAPGDVEGFWRAMRLSDIVIIQTDTVDADAAKVIQLVELFRKTSGRNRKRLIYFDELMDFYNQQGSPLRGCGNVAVRCARAGAERDLTSLFATQRAKGVPTQLWELINKLYLFRLDLWPDMARIRESSIPSDMLPPEEDHLFYFWAKSKRRIVEGPLQLEVAR